jgi:hypothetical protein
MKIGQWIAKQERKYLPSLRRNKRYKFAKAVILAPLLVPLYYLQVGIVKLKSKRISQSAIFTKMQHIVDGWTNLIIEDPVAEEIALSRASICAGCPFAEMSTGLHTVVVDNKTKQIRGMKCGKCGCPLSAKVRSLNDHCPEGKW